MDTSSGIGKRNLEEGGIPSELDLATGDGRDSVAAQSGFYCDSRAIKERHRFEYKTLHLAMAMTSVACSVAVSSVTPAGRNGPSSGFPPRHVSVSVAANYGKITSASVDVRNCRQAEDDLFVGRSSKKWSMKDEIPKVLSTVTMIGATALHTSILLNATDVANALDGVKVGARFERTCSGCHTGGGNVLQPSATLFNKDLDRNGLNSVDDVYNITYFGKNRKPGYGEKYTP